MLQINKQQRNWIIVGSVFFLAIIGGLFWYQSYQHAKYEDNRHRFVAQVLAGKERKKIAHGYHLQLAENAPKTTKSGRKTFGDVGCTESAMVNILQMAHLMPIKDHVLDNSVKRLWESAAGIKFGGQMTKKQWKTQLYSIGDRPELNQASQNNNDQPTLDEMNHYLKIASPKAAKRIQAVDVWQNDEVATLPIKAFKYLPPKITDPQLVVDQINQWQKAGYYIQLYLLTPYGTHSIDVWCLKTDANGNYVYGNPIETIDSSFTRDGKYIAADRLSNKKKMSATYKMVAYRVTNKKGKLVKSDYAYN